MRSMQLIPALSLVCVAACGGGSSDGTTNPPPPTTASSVSLSRTSVVLKPTESVVLSATPRDANGNPLSGRTIDWTASPSTGVVTLTPNGATATVTGNTSGSATITATVDQKQAQASVAVTTAIAANADVSVGASGANSFSPAEVDITSGGMVNFTWNGVTHNVTFINPPGSVSNVTDRSSGSVSVTFPQVGTYNYVCTLHSGMQGIVTVHIP